MSDYLKRLVFKCISTVLIGNSKTCPLCHRSFRRFLSHGIGPVKRRNVKCPNCRSLERHRAIWLFIQKMGLLESTSTLLHCAPEPQLRTLLQTMPSIKYITTDFCVPGCLLYMDLTHAAFKDNSFDAILCNHVLEHIVDDHAAMVELCRVLQPKGWAILQSPLDRHLTETFEDPKINTNEKRQQFYGHYDHKRLYGLDYQERLQKAGFQVSVSNFVQELPAAVAEQFGLDRHEAIYFCTKI